MRILEGVGTIIQLAGLMARLCKMVSTSFESCSSRSLFQFRCRMWIPTCSKYRYNPLVRTVTQCIQYHNCILFSVSLPPTGVCSTSRASCNATWLLVYSAFRNSCHAFGFVFFNTENSNNSENAVLLHFSVLLHNYLEVLYYSVSSVLYPLRNDLQS
jgi:hypothetical protein